MQNGAGVIISLFRVVRNQREVQDQGDPVSIDQEESRQECVYASFGKDVGVQAIAEVDGVYVVTVCRRELRLARHPR